MAPQRPAQFIRGSACMRCRSDHLGRKSGAVPHEFGTGLFWLFPGAAASPLREVQYSGSAAIFENCVIVGSRRLLRGGKAPEPLQLAIQSDRRLPLPAIRGDALVAACALGRSVGCEDASIENLEICAGTIACVPVQESYNTRVSDFDDLAM